MFMVRLGEKFLEVLVEKDERREIEDFLRDLGVWLLFFFEEFV